MSIQLKLRRGTTAQHSTFTGAPGEVTVDTDKNTVVVHNGTTPGGVPLAKQDGSNATGTWSINITGSAASATSAGTAGSAAALTAANWSVSEVGGVLFFKHAGVNKAKLDSSGNLTVTGNVTAYGTV